MKRLIFSTLLAAALVMPASAAFALPRGGGFRHGGTEHGGGRVVIAPYYSGGFYGPGWGRYDPFWGGYEWGALYGHGAPTAVAEGHLRIEVTPKDAQVFVDGAYAGVVANFDGRFRHLDLPPGGHHIEVTAEGFTPLSFDIYLQSDHTADYRGHLTRLS